MGFVENLKEKAAQNKRRIVLPEGYEERTLCAADQVLAEGFADIKAASASSTIFCHKLKADLAGMPSLVA